MCAIRHMLCGGIVLSVLLILQGCIAPPVVPAAAPAASESAATEPATEEAANAEESACVSESAPDTELAVLESLPPWTDWMDVQDPAGDWLLDHPLFEENFDAKDAFANAVPPAALDITTVHMGLEGTDYLFEFGTARAETKEGEPLSDLMQPGRHIATAGIYFDVDRNGVSDLLVTTTDEAGTAALLDSSMKAAIRTTLLDSYEDSLRFWVPQDLIGDRFDWIAFTGYSPIADAYFSTPVRWIYALPMVDIIYPHDIEANIGFSTSYIGTGVQCQVTDSQYNSCPAAGNPTMVPVLDTSYQGVQIYRVQCNDRGYAFWCINQSFFGKHVFDGAPLGWIAKCPYTCGFNVEDRWDQNGDGMVDKIFHNITDRDCGSYHDGDGDTYLDVMEHTYLYASNELTSCNRERDYQNVSTTLNIRCEPARSPYPDPAQVPGYVP